MKKLLLSLMVLALFASCGKDNKVNTGAAPVVQTTELPVTSTNPLVANDTASQLLNYINTSESSFYNPLGNPTYFKYRTYSSTYNCKEKEGWFKIEYTSCSTDNTSSDELILINTLDLEKKRQDLRDIVASASQTIEANGLAYKITTNNGSVYVIHRGAAILANPISVKILNGNLTRYEGIRYNK